MDSDVLTGMIVGVVIMFIFQFAAAFEFKEIARMKGYNDSKYFWWCFIAFGIGALMVIALPNNNMYSNRGNNYRDISMSDDLPEL